MARYDRPQDEDREDDAQLREQAHRKLDCETDTPDMHERVTLAAAAILDCGEEDIDVFFEHGQFWVTRTDDGAQWSVCDASGRGAVDGFVLEQVTEGDGERA